MTAGFGDYDAGVFGIIIYVNMVGATFYCTADSVRGKGDDGDDDSVCSDGDGTFSRTHKTYFKLI